MLYMHVKSSAFDLTENLFWAIVLDTCDINSCEAFREFNSEELVDELFNFIKDDAELIFIISAVCTIDTSTGFSRFHYRKVMRTQRQQVLSITSLRYIPNILAARSGSSLERTTLRPAW